jgi:peptidoglycan/LPS O-acetylase OafA/YrhL
MKNSFEFIRLVAAIFVLISHCCHFFKLRDPLSLLNNYQSLGGLGLNIFCIVSGYLITLSAQNHSVAKYTQNRAFRILPALLVFLLFVGLLAGPLLTKISLDEYFKSNLVYYFIATIFIFPLNTVLPGVFHGVGISGQLYSLTAELLFYAFIIFAIKKKIQWLVMVMFLFFYFLFFSNDYNSLNYSLVFDLRMGEFTVLFYAARLTSVCLLFLLVGSILALNVKKLNNISAPIAISLLALYILSYFSSSRVVFDLAELFFLPFIVLISANGSMFAFDWLKRLGDLSYGIYIWHNFFILCVVEFANELNWPCKFAIVLIFTFSSAWCSYRFIEYPSMQWLRKKRCDHVF